MAIAKDHKLKLRQEFYRRWRFFRDDIFEVKASERQLRQKLWQACGKMLSDPQKKILSYRPFPSEPAVDRLLKGARCQVYYPRIFGSALLAVAADKHHCCLELYRMDLIIVPCLLFRPDGIRLGRGGGYFDRSIRFLPQSKMLLVARHWQLEETVPAEEHDIPIRRWITDQQIYPPPKFT